MCLNVFRSQHGVFARFSLKINWWDTRYETPEEPNVLCDPIIRAFNDTIKKLEGEKVFN
ncbi:BgTH12-00002 [Blumeria graminis f. sp. triticale]|uniref:BgTH12-00002 n=1 Tax=Blumeria graminis f. sp. triticale TaxID=1689686 RepID=A0A9W4D610_BLUGR|nr:BgTH12-00002 [Blumeria graminis f. sp. triticale]